MRSVSLTVDGGVPVGLDVSVKLFKLTNPPGTPANALWLANSNPPVPCGPGPAPPDQFTLTVKAGSETGKFWQG